MSSANLTDPQSLNMYTYARNNPIDLVDPSGTHPRYTKYFLDGIEISEEMGLQMLESEAVEPSGSYSGPLGFWVDFNDWSKTDEYGFPGTGTSFVVNKSYVSKLLQESRSKPIFPVHQKEEEVGGGLGEQDGYSKSKPKGDWRVRALVRGGAPKAKAAMPVLNVIGTVMSLFTLPFASVAGSGARLSLVSAKGVRVLFKNPDDLIKAAGKLERGKRGSRIGYVKGNADEIFDSLTRGVTSRTSSGAFKLDDGTILFKYVSKSEKLPTIHINKSGRIHKIRIE